MKMAPGLTPRMIPSPGIMEVLALNQGDMIGDNLIIGILKIIIHTMEVIQGSVEMAEVTRNITENETIGIIAKLVMDDN